MHTNILHAVVLHEDPQILVQNTLLSFFSAIKKYHLAVTQWTAGLTDRIFQRNRYIEGACLQQSTDINSFTNSRFGSSLWFLTEFKLQVIQKVELRTQKFLRKDSEPT